MTEQEALFSIEMRIPNAQLVAAGEVIAVRLNSGKKLSEQQQALLSYLPEYTKVADITIPNLELSLQRSTWRMGYDGWFGLFVKNGASPSKMEISQPNTTVEKQFAVPNKKDTRQTLLTTLAQTSNELAHNGYTKFILSPIQTQNLSKIDLKLTALH